MTGQSTHRSTPRASLPRRCGTVLLGALGLLTACSGVPQRKFRFDAINTNEDPVPCLVVIDHDWAGAAAAKRVVNVGGDDDLMVDIPFEAPEVSVVVAAIKLNESTGEIDEFPSSRSESTAATSYLSGTRRLRVDDAPNLLFILEQKY